MNTEGYLIEFGNNHKIFVETELYISTLHYLEGMGYRVELAKLIKLDDHISDFEVLDRSTFGYTLEYSKIGEDETEKKHIFIPADNLESVTQHLHQMGYKPRISTWTNTMLEQIKAEDREATIKEIMEV